MEYTYFERKEFFSSFPQFYALPDIHTNRLLSEAYTDEFKDILGNVSFRNLADAFRYALFSAMNVSSFMDFSGSNINEAVRLAEELARLQGPVRRGGTAKANNIANALWGIQFAKQNGGADWSIDGFLGAFLHRQTL